MSQEELSRFTAIVCLQKLNYKTLKLPVDTHVKRGSFFLVTQAVCIKNKNVESWIMQMKRLASRLRRERS